MSLATHCIPYDPDCSICNPSVPKEASELQLLPCPFCGGNAVLTNQRMSNHHWRVGCYNELCWRPGTDWFDSEDAAVTAWNRRTPASPVSGETVAELETLLDRLIQATALAEVVPYPEHHRTTMSLTREAIRALYERQREHREFLYAENAKAEERIASLSSQLERLKADSLTPEEAHAVWALRKTSFVHPESTYAGALEKLRRLSHSSESPK